MSNNQPKSALHEGKEFISTFRTQNPLFFYSIIATIILFFIPVINILLAFYWAVLVSYKVFPKIREKFKQMPVTIAMIVGVFVGVFVAGSIPLLAYNSAFSKPQKEMVEVVKIDETKVKEAQKQAGEEKQKREQAEKEVKEERAKRENEEKSKKELEDKIAQATKINPDYDVESDIESQPVEIAKQANLVIAPLGPTTKDQKLFDVVSVVDGDTIKVSELGTLRLIGIDTPETKDPRKPVQCFGVEASNRAKELLSGKKVYLEFDPANRIDKYGRTLAYAYREDGYFYNKEMVKDGYANSYTKYPHPKMDEFNQAAKEAREGQKGLWSSTTCNGDATQPAINNNAPSSVTNTTKPANTPTPIPAPNSTAPVASNGVVKKSSTNICHAPGTTFYEKTTNFVPYNSIDECIDSGGRLPKR